MKSSRGPLRVLDGWRRLAVLIVATAAVACGGGGDSTGTNPTPSIGLSVTPTSLSLTQGANSSVTATIARSGGFAGNIDLTLEGAPTGVTASLTPSTLTGAFTTSTVTITTAASTAPGNYTLTIRAKGSGVSDQTAAVALTVAAPATPSFTMSLAPTSVSVAQGAAGTSTVTITRANGFTGAVNLALSGAPAGLTVTPNPASVATGSTTATLNVSAAAGTAAGTYPITVTASGTGVSNQTATLNVTVTAASSNNATWQFCASNAPVWLAVQDGTGAWTRVTPTNNAFSFNITSAKGGVAYVQPGSGNAFTLTVLYGLKQELSDASAGLCANTTEKTVNGSVAGLAASEAASVSLGGALASVSANGNFTLNNVPDGNRDLIAAKTLTSVSGTGITLTVNKLIIRRSQNPANGSTMTALNFGAAEAFDPIAKTVTVNGVGSDFLSTAVSYVTANNGLTTLYSDANPSSSGTRTYYGVPSAQQATGDLHLVTAVATNITGSTANYLRIAGTYFKDAADKTVTLGPVPATATVSTLATTPYVRLRMQWTAQTEYGKYFSSIYSQSNAAAPRTTIVSATSGYLGGTSVDLAIPDFTGVAGWDPNWGLKAGQATQWIATGTGWSSAGGVTSSPAVEGGTLLIGSRIGSITP
ncbi:MAG TPA: hypothetical protein VI259_22360 [Gemmatimonadaceae bacterium]